MCCVRWPQLEGRAAGCLCSVESDVCTHWVNLVEWCKHCRNKRERRAKWTYYIHNTSLGRYTRVSCNKQHIPLLLLSLFSARPKISTVGWVSADGAIKNVKRQICQEGIRHEVTQVAIPQPARKPLLSLWISLTPFWKEITQCMTFRHDYFIKNQNVS